MIAVAVPLVGMTFTTSDGVFKYAGTSYTTSPMELVSTLTTTANRSLDGTIVQCEGGGGGRSVTANITLIRNVDNDQGSPQRVLEKCLMAHFSFMRLKQCILIAIRISNLLCGCSDQFHWGEPDNTVNLATWILMRR